MLSSEVGFGPSVEQAEAVDKRIVGDAERTLGELGIGQFKECLGMSSLDEALSGGEELPSVRYEWGDTGYLIGAAGAYGRLICIATAATVDVGGILPAPGHPSGETVPWDQSSL